MSYTGLPRGYQSRTGSPSASIMHCVIIKLPRSYANFNTVSLYELVAKKKRKN